MNSNIRQYIEVLGCAATDRVTGARGILTSVSFDLYGCLQYVIQPPHTPDGKPSDGRWFDKCRLDIDRRKGRGAGIRPPDFDLPPYSDGFKGAADKPGK